MLAKYDSCPLVDVCFGLDLGNDVTYLQWLLGRSGRNRPCSQKPQKRVCLESGSGHERAVTNDCSGRIDGTVELPCQLTVKTFGSR